MPTFKVTLHIQDGLTLGHVLMTKGVELIHIVETDAPLLLTDGKSDRIIDIPHQQVKHFKHPSGKPIKEFVMEFLLKDPNKKGRWQEINKHITGLGFGKSSLNNSLKFLVENGVIKREKDGLYKVIERK